MDCIVKIGQLRKNLKKYTTPTALMVKANAYGHGMELIKKTNDLVTAYGVATEEEGLKIRQYTDKPILITAPSPRWASLYSTYGFTPMVSNPLFLVALNDCSKSVVKTHLKVDTGMGRFGVKTLKETRNMIKIAEKLNKVEISGICTHFSSLGKAVEQMEIFDKHIELAESYLGRLLTHAAASGTVSVDKYDLRRVGFSAYANVMTVKSRIMSVKTLKKGEQAGYDGVFEAKAKTKIAVVSGGYADGIPRNSIGFAVKIRNKKHKIVAVCMDIFIVQLSETCELDDEVTIINGMKSLEELSSITGKIPYELYVGFHGRCNLLYEN